jgi:chitin disaccharide deacetylase
LQVLLIVNADDLGTSQPINDEIFALMESGLVTSATIIANAPAFEHAAKRIACFPNCSFGVHLNLTVFRPLSDGGGLEPLLDENGRLSRKLFQATMSVGLRAALLRELAAQVQRTLEAGVPISHFDSHEHVHTVPGLFPVLKRLQRRFGVRKVRSTINVLPGGQRMTALRSFKKWSFNVALRHLYATGSPEGFGDFRDFHTALRAGRFPRFRCLELMVHPGTSSRRYNEEVALLRSDWQRLLPPDVKLGSYHSI